MLLVKEERRNWFIGMQLKSKKYRKGAAEGSPFIDDYIATSEQVSTILQRIVLPYIFMEVN